MSMIVPNVEELIPANHRYRKLLTLLDWKELSRPLRSLYSDVGRRGYPVEQAFKCMFLQFLEDRSDRQMELYLQENLAAKYFCNFGLKDQTPDSTFFSKFRERVGTERIAAIFKRLVASLKKQGLVREVYTFVDSSKIVACVDTWKARDRAIADVENQEQDDDNNPTMNNRNLEEYSSDPDARFGVKGKNDIWLGYKQHVAVDTHQGLISTVVVAPANVHDGKAFQYTAPSQGAVLGDKLYGDGPAQAEMQRRGLHSMAIKKRNAKGKDHKLDSFLSALRMPFEGVFSKMTHRARYRGLEKTQLQALMQAMALNLKRLVTINAEPIPLF